MKKLNKRGFTIVELVIVIAVIAILAAVLIPTFGNVINKANQSAVLQEARSLYEEAMAMDLADGVQDAHEEDCNCTCATSGTCGCESFDSNGKDCANGNCNPTGECGCTTHIGTNKNPIGDKTVTYYYINKDGKAQFKYEKNGHTAVFDGENWEVDPD